MNGATPSSQALGAATVSDESLPSDERVALALRAARDITEVVGVLASLDADNLTPAVLQMVQQRIHELACGICDALQGPIAAVWEIRSQLYPSEPAQGGADA